MHPTAGVDVAIVGGGPVGLGLALDLALRNVSVTVIERRLTAQRIPKGQNLTQRTGEHFRAWGVSEAIRAASPIPPEYGNEGLTAYGSLLSGHHYDWFKRASVRSFYAADNERLPQYETERVLRERVEALDGVSLLLGWRFASVRQYDDGVELAIVDAGGVDAGGVDAGGVDAGGDAKRTLTARFLVGCDGAHSPVREALALPQTVDRRGRRMALVVFRSSELHQLLQPRFPGKTIFNALRPDLEGYWQFLGRVDTTGTWFFHAPVPDDATRENYDFEGLLERAVGASFQAELQHIGFWDMQFTQADRYRAGNAFIAGDAAHSHPPYGGYGVNLGFEDARNLGWKLTAALRGYAGEDLLASYEQERHPVFASTRDHFIARMIDDDAQFVAQHSPQTDRPAFEAAWSERATGGQKEVAAYVPNYAGSAIVWGAEGAHSGARGAHLLEARAGHHLAPLPLADGSDVYDRLGTGFTLLAIEQSPAVVEDFQRAAQALAMPLSIVETARTEATRGWQATLILVRPDAFVAYAGDTLAVSPSAILRKAVGARSGS